MPCPSASSVARSENSDPPPHPHPPSRDGAQVAELSRANVLALRLYTTSSFPLFNGPLRAGVCPHPLRMTVYYLAEGLKALRRVEARAAPEEFNKVRASGRVLGRTGARAPVHIGPWRPVHLSRLLHWLSDAVRGVHVYDSSCICTAA